MRIGEFSRLTGVSIDTLRYYEKEGLLSPRRDFNDRRDYDETDVKWVEFLMRLKETGMPIREIGRYAELRSEGDGTMRERLDMLISHRRFLDGQIRKLLLHRKKLDEKILFYRERTP